MPPSNAIMRGSYAGNDAPMFGSNPGSNQYMGGPTPFMATPGNSRMPEGGGGVPWMSNPYAASNPYQVPSATSPGYGSTYGGLSANSQIGPPGKGTNIGHGIIATGLQYPGLSADFANWLNTQVGQGMTPYNLEAPLPTGGLSQPGQLTAGLNPLLQQLQNFFKGGDTNIPGLMNLSNIANNGVSALPEWQAMVQAMQQNIGQNQANLKEQFGSMGDLAGSPFGTAMSNYMQQTTADQNSLLGQLQQSNIQNIQMPAIESLFGGSQQMAGGLQALDQQAIQNQYQEFQRIQPQNNPMMQYIMGLSTMYPPTTRTPTTWENVNSTISALGGSGFSTGGSGGTQVTF